MTLQQVIDALEEAKFQCVDPKSNVLVSTPLSMMDREVVEVVHDSNNVYIQTT